jgi:ABC-type dipeptide/oligopeptide/nickel transport system ATPase component
VRFVSGDFIVVYQDRVAEQGQRDAVFYNPLHPCAQMLLNTLKGECIQPESNGIPDMFIGWPYYPKCDKRISLLWAIHTTSHRDRKAQRGLFPARIIIVSMPSFIAVTQN